MAACEAFENRLLDPSDQEAVAHLATCSGCAAEAAALQAALSAVALPPQTASEKEGLSHLAASSFSAWRRTRGRAYARRRAWTLALVAAAAAVLVLGSRVGLHLGAQSVGPRAPEVSAVEADTMDPVEVTGVAFADDGTFEVSEDDTEGDGL